MNKLVSFHAVFLSVRNTHLDQHSICILTFFQYIIMNGMNRFPNRFQHRVIYMPRD